MRENTSGVLCAIRCCSLQDTLQPASNSSTKPDGCIKVKKSHQQSFEFRKKIETKKGFGQQKPYEGSLWRYESSFGNILRDHRARFRGDLFTISELPSVVNVPEPKAEAEAEAAAPTNNTQRANLLLEAITMRDEIEREQNDILRSLEQCPHGLPKFCPMAT